MDKKLHTRQVANLAIEAMRGSRRAYCFRAWRSHVSDTQIKQKAFLRKQRAVRCALAAGSELARERRRRVFRKCFRAWHAWTGTMSRARSLWAKVERQTVRKVWGRWQMCVRAMQSARREDMMAFEFWRTGLAWRVLQLWQSVVSQQKRDMREMTKVTVAHMHGVHRRRVLRAWQQHITGQRALIMQLQVCACPWQTAL